MKRTSTILQAETAATRADFTPLVHELPTNCDSERAFLSLCALPHCVFFDSARRHPSLGRYSFIAADPFDYWETQADGGEALAPLAEKLGQWRAAPVDGLPPFQGGAAGLFSYDLGRSLENLPDPRQDEFATPALAIGFYDVVVAFDHATGRAWIISQGFPETEPAARRRGAQKRLEDFRERLLQPVITPVARLAIDAIPLSALAPQFATPGPADLTSNFSAEDYLSAVARAIEYVYAGDVFQVNLSQRLLHPAQDDAVDLYLRLRRRNPATFAGYFDTGAFQIVSASPERFLRINERRIETRPIKGTRQRIARPEADLFAGDDLQESEKDRAENVMIVDLLRNDLARVCQADSVRVTQLCRLESYEYVQHLVSAVEGTLRDEVSPVDVIRATFPGGSVTGAPKIRAMEIIAELEPTARGPYCGALGYIGFDGSVDMNILIRTITAGRGWWQLPVGGGIIAQSIPAREHEETWHKAEGMLRALQ